MPGLTEFAVHVERDVVEQLPEDTVAKPVVVQVHSALVQVHRDIFFLGERLSQLVPVWPLIHMNPCTSAGVRAFPKVYVPSKREKGTTCKAEVIMHFV